VDAFFQEDSACRLTVNVILDSLHDVFGSCFLLNQFPEHSGCGWFWPPCSPDMNPCVYFLWVYLRIMCSAPIHTLFRSCKQKLKLLLKRSQVTCCMTQLTALWFVYSEFMRLNILILNMCSHDLMHTNSP
jgi:hypothetical protein